jgi:hypothetical protein
MRLQHTSAKSTQTSAKRTTYKTGRSAENAADKGARADTAEICHRLASSGFANQITRTAGRNTGAQTDTDIARTDAGTKTGSKAS